MKILGLSFLVVVALISEVGYSEITSTVREFVKNQDDLGLRIYLKDQLKAQLTIEDWLATRRVLASRPNAGYDLVFAWDRHKNVKGLDLNQTYVDKALNEADALFENRKFEEAFKKYQVIARTVKKSGKNIIRLQNRQFYFSILHSMARSLYGAGRFADSLEVYNWIPPYYFQIQQVLFEKMWSAFRAQKFDQVVGSIASQQSGYFSHYLDPESYLIKIYVMKRLCREKDVNLTLKSIEEYLQGLKTGKISYKEWARRDLVLSSLVFLTDENEMAKPLLKLVNNEKRNLERKRLTEYLSKTFEKNKIRITSQLQKVVGYAKLALSADSPALTNIAELPDADTISKSGLEWWPATGGEEWMDEIGSHVFVGDSQCSSVKK